MNEVIYEIECYPEEDVSPEGQFATGDDERDNAIVRDIIERLETNEWAWCCVRVVARLDGTDIEGDSYLGCCSYDSEDDFRENSGYYEDMKQEAKDRLLRAIDEIRKAIA